MFDENSSSPSMDVVSKIENQSLDRRDVLKAALGLSLTGFFSGGIIQPAMASSTRGAHRVSFRNIHTNETFSGVYRVGDKYLPEAFDRITHVLRDYRTNTEFPIDPRVIDIIYVVHRMTGARTPYDILSGYRSPQTNALLRRASGGGVARNSLHMSGQAIDVQLPDRNPSVIRAAAKRLHAGGVGYYPRSGFVHMDSGDFRTW